MTLNDLLSQKSQELPQGAPALGSTEVAQLISLLDGWALSGDAIARTYQFKDFRQTMRFVNQVADLANAENHHPDLEVSYSKCTVRFSTHSVSGLSQNDFICAAKVEQIPR